MRVVKLAATTKSTNAIFGTGGDLKMVPDYAVTVGMKEILASREIHIFLDWLWQRRILRDAIHGPITRFCPASYIQTLKNVTITMADYVAQRHSVEPE